MRCNKCGTETQPGDIFCSGCGNKLAAQTEPITPTMPILPDEPATRVMTNNIPEPTEPVTRIMPDVLPDPGAYEVPVTQAMPSKRSAAFGTDDYDVPATQAMPQQPYEPVAPTVPATQAMPQQPYEPVEPTVSVTQAMPQQPYEPVAPTVPATQAMPQQPHEPVEPTVPVTQAIPDVRKIPPVPVEIEQEEDYWTKGQTPDQYGGDPYDPGVFGSGFDDGAYDNEDEYDDDGKSGANTVIIAIISAIIIMLILFAGFNVLLVTGKINVGKTGFLAGYKESLCSFLHISTGNGAEDDETTKAGETTTGSSAGKESTTKADSTKELTTKETTAKETTTKETTTKEIATAAQPTTAVSSSKVPAALKEYESGLVPVDAVYVVTLKSDDAHLNYRSTPQVINGGAENSNWLGQMANGTEIYVEYIYNNTWAVFRRGNQYAFASLYAKNDPTQNRILVQK